MLLVSPVTDSELLLEALTAACAACLALGTPWGTVARACGRMLLTGREL